MKISSEVEEKNGLAPAVEDTPAEKATDESEVAEETCRRKAHVAIGANIVRLVYYEVHYQQHSIKVGNASKTEHII